MKKIRIAASVLTLVLTLFTFQPVFAAPQPAPSAWDLLAAVNALRAANGLPAFQVDGYLMASAQGQADYLASIGPNVGNGHAGPGGNTVDDRAYAAGLPYVAGLDITECWAMTGANGTLEYVIYTIWNDPDHMGVMLSTKGLLAGVGVAVSGDWIYYILDVANYFGEGPTHVSITTTSAVPASGTSGAAPAGNLTPVVSQYIAPVKQAEPAADGSVTHTVLSGQSLWSIAMAYDVQIEDIRQLNALSAATLIYPGQKLLIKPSAAAMFTLTPTVMITPTALPENIPTAVVPLMPALAVTESAQVPTNAVLSPAGLSPLYITLLVIFGLGLLLVAAGFLLRH